MKLIIFNFKILFFFIVFNILSLTDTISLNSTHYYEEKYFRILSNNYEDIIQGEFWKYDDEAEGFGFIANKDFGSLILLKDWSMYNFKLTKVIFRNTSKISGDGLSYDAEMWLIHTKDNGYYPPGRRIFIKQNYFIIVVPFKKTDDNNPAVDMILETLDINKFAEQNSSSIIPKKPVKLYKIIQNQPSILFEGEYRKKETLFMVFSQYHFISNTNFDNLNKIYENHGKTVSNFYDFDPQKDKIYRNVKNEEDIIPKVTLMSYSKASFLNTILPFFILFLF